MLGLTGIAFLGYFVILFSNTGEINVFGQIPSQTGKMGQVLLILVVSLLLSTVFLHEHNTKKG
jgi:hypothetical protein